MHREQLRNDRRGRRSAGRRAADAQSARGQERHVPAADARAGGRGPAARRRPGGARDRAHRRRRRVQRRRRPERHDSSRPPTRAKAASPTPPSLPRCWPSSTRLPKPLIGRINGSAFGGGLGLISICDIAIGLADATFRLSEVTLGLIAGHDLALRRGQDRRAQRAADHAQRPQARRQRWRRGWDCSTRPSPAIDELDAAVEREVAAALQLRPAPWPTPRS